MLNVFITVDTEVWCNGWDNLEQRFSDQFRKYVYGPTRQGDFALPGTLSILEEYNIPAVFFVEPLFSAKFGLAPLQEIVGILQEKDQEIQLHLHSEWVDEAGDRLLPGITEKLRNLTYCSREQQRQLIQWGLARMSEAGADGINAFRAGSYCANRDTLRALADNKLTFDTSYNLAGSNGVADMSPGEILSQPRRIDSIFEYPVSTIKDPLTKNFRHMQINSLSSAELLYCLNSAYAMGLDSLVVVTHNFELLSPDKTRVDAYALKRFRDLCRYLDDNRDRFLVRGFRELTPSDVQPQPDIASGRRIPAGLRFIEQAVRRALYH